MHTQRERDYLPQCEVECAQVDAARQVHSGLGTELQGQRTHRGGLVEREGAAICESARCTRQRRKRCVIEADGVAIGTQAVVSRRMHAVLWLHTTLAGQ